MSYKSTALELPCVTRHCLLHAVRVLNPSETHLTLPRVGLQNIERFCGELSQLTQLGRKGISLPDPLLLQTIHIHKFAEGAITAEDFTKLVEQQLLKVTVGRVPLDLDALQRLCWSYYKADKRSVITFPKWLSPECTYRLWLIFNTVTDSDLVTSVSQNTVNEVVKRLIELCGYTWNSAYQYTKQKEVKFPECIEAITDYFDQLHLDTSLTCEVIASLEDEVVNGVIKKGHLKKKGHKRKNWLKRWFILQKTTLRYYETRESSKPKGQLVLNGATTVKSIPDSGDKKYHFLVTCGHTGVPFQICADDQQAKQEWILAIKKAIALAKIIEGSSSTRRDSFTESVAGFYLLKYGTRVPTLSRQDSDLQQHMTAGALLRLSNTGLGTGGDRTRQTGTSTGSISDDEPLEEYLEMQPGVLTDSDSEDESLQQKQHARNEKYTGLPYEIPVPQTIPPGDKASLKRAASTGSTMKPYKISEPAMGDAPSPVVERHKRDTLGSIDSGRGSIESPPPLPARENTPPPFPVREEDTPPPLPSREEKRKLIRNTSAPFDTRGGPLAQQTTLTSHLSHRKEEQPPIPARRRRSQSAVPQSVRSPIHEHSPAIIAPGPTSRNLSSDVPHDTPPTPPPRVSPRHQKEPTRNVPPLLILPDEKPPPVPRHRSGRSVPTTPDSPGLPTATLPTIRSQSSNGSENVSYSGKSLAVDQQQSDRPVPKPRRSLSARAV